MKQGSLFGGGGGAYNAKPTQPKAPYQKHSETSRETAESKLPNVGTELRRVLDYLVSVGKNGATDQEIQIALGMDPSTERPRRVELVRRKDVVDSGYFRDTTSGRSAVVWRASEA